MLFYNPNIRRKITYKLPILFDEVQVEKKEIYSYSVFTDDYKEKEIVFKERKINVFQFNQESNFMDSLKVYNEKNKLVIKHFFSKVDRKNSIMVNRPDSIIFEFKESNDPRYFTTCHGYLKYINDNQREYYNLSFHRVRSYLGYKVNVKLFKNDEGDFYREEFYNSENETIEYVLENKFEYIETDLETRAQSILQNGWD